MMTPQDRAFASGQRLRPPAWLKASIIMITCDDHCDRDCDDDCDDNKNAFSSPLVEDEVQSDATIIHRLLQTTAIVITVITMISSIM